ncbi:hypothetical protein CEXT_412691 [Caerostris extrusa]|uniref:Uncharacterized protein n=1 Tax=Caerostris extrusa TaxID=172846 RepID=A0AAV4N7H4_CAEEX|nr:hypothetical protein CEXT_412691 [Caerostris extrusa]
MGKEVKKKLHMMRKQPLITQNREHSLSFFSFLSLRVHSLPNSLHLLFSLCGTQFFTPHFFWPGLDSTVAKTVNKIATFSPPILVCYFLTSLSLPSPIFFEPPHLIRSVGLYRLQRVLRARYRRCRTRMKREWDGVFFVSGREREVCSLIAEYNKQYVKKKV